MRNPRAVARMILADIVGLRIGESVTYRTEHLEAAFYGASPRLAGRPIEAIIQAGLPRPEIGVWEVERYSARGICRITRRARLRAAQALRGDIRV